MVSKRWPICHWRNKPIRVVSLQTVGKTYLLPASFRFHSSKYHTTCHTTTLTMSASLRRESNMQNSPPCKSVVEVESNWHDDLVLHAMPGDLIPIATYWTCLSRMSIVFCLTTFDTRHLTFRKFSSEKLGGIAFSLLGGPSYPKKSPLYSHHKYQNG